jgi:hypothetical protein
VSHKHEDVVLKAGIHAGTNEMLEAGGVPEGTGMLTSKNTPIAAAITHSWG